MKHTTLGALEVSRIGLGAMSMSGAYGAATDEAESIRTIHRALELGVTFIDTAEAYGPFNNEELVGRAVKGRRGEVVIATRDYEMAALLPPMIQQVSEKAPGLTLNLRPMVGCNVTLLTDRPGGRTHCLGRG